MIMMKIKKRVQLLLLFSIILVLSILFVAFRLNTSSVAAFCSYLPIGCVNEKTIFADRPIRSDEWLVGTPLYMSRISSHTGGSFYIGDEEPSPMYSQNYKIWKYFMPFSHLPLTQDAEKLVSWASLSGYLATFLVFFGYLFLLSSNIAGSLLFAVSGLLIAFLQWWSTHRIVGSVLSTLLIFLIWLNHKKSARWIWLYAIAGIYSLSVSALHLYPPFQIPLYWLVLFAVIGFSLNKLEMLTIKKVSEGAIILLLSFLGAFLISKAFLSEFPETLSAIENSFYPGKRLSVGGDFPLWKVFSGFYDMQLLNSGKPLGDINQSEAAGFINVFIFVAPIVLWSEIRKLVAKKKNDWLVLSLTFVILALATYMLVGFHPLLAKITLMERVPGARANIAFGTGGFLLTGYLLFSYKYHNHRNRLHALAIAIFSFSTILFVGYLLKSIFPLFISNDLKILSIATSVSLLSFLLYWQSKMAFMLFFTLYSILIGLKVHPLRSGLKPITSSAFSSQVIELNGKNPGRWAAYNNHITSALIYANKINTATGVFLYPQQKWWQHFDKDNKYFNVWNRYAHVFFVEPTTNNNEIKFSLIQQDLFLVEISPCHPILDSLEVKYFVSHTPLSADCLDIIEPKGHALFIYQKKI